MELLEYQAKQLFEQVGIPTLPSQIIADPRELKQLQIPYPIVLKSQVRAGGRGKAGGIKRVQNTIDAIAAARNIFNLAIAGQYPDVLLAEAHYERKQEIFLAVVLDYELQRPVLLGSAHGGMEIEQLLANLHQVVIQDFFSPFQARHLLNKMGIRGPLVPALSDIIKKMYDLLLGKDLELVEINPLGINQAGELMALDGKVTVHDTALRKHPEIDLFYAHQNQGNYPMGDPLAWQSEVPGGKVGIVCYGVGAAALSWDLLQELGGQPAYCWILGPQSQGLVFSPYDLEGHIGLILEQLASLPEIEVLFLNLVADKEINQQILAKVIASFPGLATEKDLGHSPMQIVVRCLPDIDQTIAPGCHWESDLEAAIHQAIALSKA
ncbi:succinate-CoA ligase beta chain [[Synechococcus] sp. NIES-970]|uniref:ATP-grasp domain-containing protein n=1 Tax=Picosynechococcus sp. NKBG15041c TaxID=1407650 RepID=UPI000418A83D|nr:ATP-grasp domain-containing protein [Picosynechococcus sp. NKBG15041c]BAW96267.1 succinate-CoA ligase beta chain [[Synechococcus] sp. NIES-970]